MVPFQWGFLPGAKPREDLMYKVGDAIRWRACEDGSVVPWAAFVGSTGYNFGDPQYQDLIAREAAGWLDDYLHDCGQQVGGAAVEISRGVIRRVWVYPPGEFDNMIDHYQLDSGLPLPRADWTNHSVTHVDLAECGPALRLV